MASVPAVPVTDPDLLVGLEDFDESDAVMPTLSIAHKEGLFVDGLSGETYSDLEVILLGLVKGRILWPSDLGTQKESPLCKSYNFDHGRPDPLKPDRFPWKASGFKMADFAEQPVLPCEGCKLKDWGSNPKTDSPWCTEQHQYILLLPVGDDYSPAVLTIQRTGLKPSRAYATNFSRAKEPLFITTTKLTLSQQRKGSVDYSVPQFLKGSPTDPEQYSTYANTYRRIRAFLQTPRIADAETEAVEETPVAAPVGAPSAPAADDLPF